jgi:hypothetical protein
LTRSIPGGGCRLVFSSRTADRESPIPAGARKSVFTGYEVSDFVELGVVFLAVGVTLGLMVIFGKWWSH